MSPGSIELRVSCSLRTAHSRQELSRESLAVTSSTMRQAGVTVAIAWHFTQQMLPEVVSAADFQRLVAFSAAAEALPEFRAAPHGEGTYRHDG